MALCGRCRMPALCGPTPCDKGPCQKSTRENERLWVRATFTHWGLNQRPSDYEAGASIVDCT
eukprot:1688721-Amphidinium_carterae.1